MGSTYMARSKLDSIYRRMLITRFFEKGWGKPENLKRLFEFRKIISNRESCMKLVPPDYPIEITKEERASDCTIVDGKFMTPFEFHLPGIVPEKARPAYFQMLIPHKWKDDQFKPMCIHLAGTGDHFFWRRRHFIAKPLLKEASIGAIILENPFYGLRKPDDQVRSNLQNVSDIFVMGGCLLLECLVLLHWCERNGYGPLGVTGLSMGGHMASLAATNWPKPLVLVPCLSWSTAASVFTTGVMSQSINWDMLETQYHSDGQYKDRLSKMVNVVDEAFSAGQKFIKNFNESMEELQRDIKHTRKEVLKDGNVVEETARLASSLPMPTKISKVETKTLTKLMKYILPRQPQQPPPHSKIDITKTNWWERDALQFMRGMMDECTHLKNFSVPYDTSLIIAICAKDDAYVPREGCSNLEDIWPGAEVRYLDAGHVSAYVLHQRIFRSCIIEAFERAKKVYAKRNEEFLRREAESVKAVSSPEDHKTSKAEMGECINATVTYQQLLNKYANSTL